MSRAYTAMATLPTRLHPLLFAPCTCAAAIKLPCLACARWRRQYRAVTLRRNASGAAR